MIDSIHFGGQGLVVALGIAEGGEKHIKGKRLEPIRNNFRVAGSSRPLTHRQIYHEQSGQE
jgi:hypothetical protein